MPCDQLITISLTLDNVDATLLSEVLAEMDLDRVVAYSQGKLMGNENILTLERVGEIKKQYAEKRIKQSAKRMGWKIEKQRDGKLRVHR